MKYDWNNTETLMIPAQLPWATSTSRAAEPSKKRHYNGQNTFPQYDSPERNEQCLNCPLVECVNCWGHSNKARNISARQRTGRSLHRRLTLEEVEQIKKAILDGIKFEDARELFMIGKRRFYDIRKEVFKK